MRHAVAALPADRLAPHWTPVEDCRAREIDRGAEVQVWFSTRVERDGTRNPIHLACAMEAAGNRVTGSCWPARDRRAQCPLSFRVIVGSDTHPGMNPRFAELAQRRRLVDGTFGHDAARGGRRIARHDEADSFVPTEFRNRSWRG